MGGSSSKIIGADCASLSEGQGPRSSTYKAVGIILAICSGLFIGTSFVLKKTGLLKANAKYSEEAGEGYGYLKNAWWWSGMILMIIGEICNFVAYAFVDAILVTPLGALSVVVTTILSAIFLKERLSFVGKMGCFNCIVGSVVIVLNSPAQSSASNIQQMECYVISPGFLVYAGVIIVGCAFIALWAGPRYGKKSMLVYLSICSLIGGLSVVATQGLGSAIVAQAGGLPQFNQWFTYILLVFVITTLVTEIIFLNKALNIFNAAMVTPTYYVYFTSSTIVTSAILFRGFKGTPIQIVTIVLGFLQICTGVILLQLSKSSKDVPDAAVFKGDLDQVRTVAEQAEEESEPKADAIRGAAAIIRSISKSRQKREVDEAKRVQSERLEPIGENEHVEWDGLRRRKTVLDPGQKSRQRPNTMHPPLGLTHFPTHGDDEPDRHPHAGLSILPGLRKHAHTVLNPLSAGSRRFSGRSTSYGSNEGGKQTVHLDDMSGARIASASSQASGLPDYDDGTSRPHILGLPPGLQDTSYKSPNTKSIQFSDEPRPGTSEGYLSPGPTGNNRRQFSFQNVFSKAGRKSSGSEHERPLTSSTVRSSMFGSIIGKKGGVSEEERLGLVLGDSSTALVRKSREARTREDSDEDDDIGGLAIRKSRRGNTHDDNDDDDFEHSDSESYENVPPEDWERGGPRSPRRDPGGPGGVAFV